LIFNKNTQNIVFNYSIINENNIEQKKILKFFISTLLECNVMVNETIKYKSPSKTKSVMHFLNTDKETRISPVGVYSSLGEVDYFAFQRSTKTFKVDFLEELTSDLKNSDEIINERKYYRSIENGNFEDKTDIDSNYRKNNNFNFNGFENVIFLDSKENLIKEEPSDKILDYNYKVHLKDKEIINNDNNKKHEKNHLKKSIQYNSNNEKNLKLNINKNNKKISINDKDLSTNEKKNINEITNSFTSKTQYKYENSDNSNANLSQFFNLTKQDSQNTPNDQKFVDFSLEYIYDAKHLIHSISDFRSTPDFNNITYNYDRIIWNLINENYDKSDEIVKIQLFFDMEESFYSENIFMNLNFTKSIFLLNETEKRAIENSYTKIDSNIILETANYSYTDGSVYLMEKKMNSSPDLDKIQYYVKNKNSKNNKNDLIKIMKIEAEKILKYNETFQLEVKFPLYFENCRNYKTNTMIMITGIVLMVFLGSMLYLIVSLNFSDKN